MFKIVNGRVTFEFKNGSKFHINFHDSLDDRIICYNMNGYYDTRYFRDYFTGPLKAEQVSKLLEVSKNLPNNFPDKILFNQHFGYKKI